MKHGALQAQILRLTGFDVPRETVERLSALAELLQRWNARVNLVRIRGVDELWERHILDSLQLLPLLPPVARAVDLGSGAGFPGLILAIASPLHFDLIESDQRKAAFLREAVRITGADAAVHACRIEQAKLAPAPLITARALAFLPDLLALAQPLLAPDGICIFPKGEKANDELTAAAKKWHMTVERFPSRTHSRSIILRIGNLRRA